MLTERSNPKTYAIDRASSLEIVTIINAEDATIAQTVQNALPHIAAAVDIIVASVQAGGHVFYVGAGTSGRLGVLDAVECVPTFGTSPTLFQAIIAGGESAFIQAVEGAEDDFDAGATDLRAANLTAQDVVVGIAASGRTPYVLGAVAFGRNIGAQTIGISCNSPAPLLEQAQTPIAIPVGPEVIAGSTRMKAGTAQKMVLNMLSSASMIRLGKVYRNLMVDVKVTNEKLARRARDIIVQLSDLSPDAAASLLEQADHHVKTALVMHRKGLDATAARTLLDEHGGLLQHILEET
ncbi:MAG: N-acetylmuramic acid 6-phosphate etherase [Anaerolineales bacterium]